MSKKPPPSALHLKGFGLRLDFSDMATAAAADDLVAFVASARPSMLVWDGDSYVPWRHNSAVVLALDSQVGFVIGGNEAHFIANVATGITPRASRPLCPESSASCPLLNW